MAGDQVICPCCGHRVIDEMLPEGLQLSNLQRRIFSIVQRAGPSGIPADVLVERVYANDPNGGPLTARRSVYVTICKLNSKLLDYKMVLRANGGGHGSFGEYVLKRL